MNDKEQFEKINKVESLLWDFVNNHCSSKFPPIQLVESLRLIEELKKDLESH